MVHLHVLSLCDPHTSPVDKQNEHRDGRPGSGHADRLAISTIPNKFRRKCSLRLARLRINYLLKIGKLIALLCTWFFNASDAQVSKVDSSAMVTLRIDPESARGGAVSQYFEKVSFIPLETTKESLFGSIAQLKTSKNHFIIFDYDTQAVLIFNRDGKFKAKVSGREKIFSENDQQGQQSYYGFQLIRYLTDSAIKIQKGKYSYLFDLDGKLIKKELSSTEPYFSNFTSNNQNRVYTNYLSKQTKDSTHYEVAVTDGIKELGLFFPFSSDKYKNDQYLTGAESLKYSATDHTFFFIRSYEYNIYKLRPTSLSLCYHLIFPAANSIPKDFLTKAELKNKRIEYFEKFPDQIYAIGNPYQFGDNLYFKTYQMGWNTQRKNSLIYNLKNAQLTSIKNIDPDSLSQFLPITDAGISHDFHNQGFHASDGEYLYTSYSSMAMFAFKELSSGKVREYDPLLSKYFKEATKKSNPVIIQLKPKTN